VTVSFSSFLTTQKYCYTNSSSSAFAPAQEFLTLPRYTLNKMFLICVFIALTISVLWWRLTDRRLGRLRHGLFWRIALAIFLAAMIFFPLGGNVMGQYFPAALPAAGLMWHVFAAPLGVIVLMLFDLAWWLQRRLKKAVDAPTILSRRRAMTACAAVIPPLIAGGLTGACMEELGTFRVRALELTPDGWPPKLNGLSIAFIADVHTGPFTTPAMLRDIVDRTNKIHNNGPADLVILGGDLINTTLRDLPDALEMATALRSRFGTFCIMGNHDVMQDRAAFIDGVERAGIPILLERVATISPVPGASFQLLGVDWAGSDQNLWQSVARVSRRRDPNLFPICLAHHPHAWDAAVWRGLPLMLSAHTHGGQIMLTENIGGGPLKFRYWSGVHHRNGSTLAITNGVGNWFPLRVNAPAEILKIVLRSPQTVV
jgi:predicted MPP superfamily phosphohydrolase